MELTPQERERIYFEEKLLRESNEGTSLSLVLLNLLAVVGLLGVFFISQKLGQRQISLEDIRKAYSGLSPDDPV